MPSTDMKIVVEFTLPVWLVSLLQFGEVPLIMVLIVEPSNLMISISTSDLISSVCLIGAVLRSRFSGVSMMKRHILSWNESLRWKVEWRLCYDYRAVRYTCRGLCGMRSGPLLVTVVTGVGNGCECSGVVGAW